MSPSTRMDDAWGKPSNHLVRPLGSDKCRKQVTAVGIPGYIILIKYKDLTLLPPSVHSALPSIPRLQPIRMPLLSCTRPSRRRPGPSVTFLGIFGHFIGRLFGEVFFFSLQVLLEGLLDVFFSFPLNKGVAFQINSHQMTWHVTFHDGCCNFFSMPTGSNWFL